MTKESVTKLYMLNTDVVAAGAATVCRRFYSVTKISENQTVDTIYGKITVMKGNYILTDDMGNSVGITEVDLNSQYKEVEE